MWFCVSTVIDEQFQCGMPDVCSSPGKPLASLALLGRDQVARRTKDGNGTDSARPLCLQGAGVVATREPLRPCDDAHTWATCHNEVTIYNWSTIRFTYYLIYLLLSSIQSIKSFSISSINGLGS